MAGLPSEVIDLDYHHDPAWRMRYSTLKLLVLSNRLWHPSTVRLVEMLTSQGIEVETMGYLRGHPPVRSPAGQHTDLGSVRNSSYYRRIPSMARNSLRIRRAIGRNELVLVDGADVASVAHIAGYRLSKPVVRYVADIERLAVLPGLRARAVRKIDRLIEARCRLLLLTSPDAAFYYRDWLKLDVPVFVLENRVEQSRADAWQRWSADAPDEPKDDKDAPPPARPIRIGWFAQIRDRWSLELIEHLCREFGSKFEVVIAGFVASNIRDFEHFLERNPTVEYLGPFSQVDDLPRLHSRVDMSLAAVSPELPTSVAVSNRYHDSCMLGTPLVVRGGTTVGKRVAKHQIGIVLNQIDPRHAAAELAVIAPDDVLAWRTNMQKLPPEFYLHRDAPAGLAAALRAISESE